MESYKKIENLAVQDYEKLCGSHHELLEVCKYSLSQMERVREWFEKNSKDESMDRILFVIYSSLRQAVEKSKLAPKISVIIPTYNGALDLSKAIESVLNQTYKAHEIIVVDDGSIDSTEKVVKEYIGTQGFIYKKIENGGVSNARNTGIDLSAGDYIAFLDHDDTWNPERLQSTVYLIEKYPLVGFFFCNTLNILTKYEEKNIIHSSGIKHPDLDNLNKPLIQDPIRHLLFDNFVGSPSSIIVKKVLRDGFSPRFDSKLKLGEDFDFYLKMSQHTDFVFDKNVLMNKFKRDGGASFDIGKAYETHRQKLLDFCDKERAFIANHLLFEDLPSALYGLDTFIANIYFREKHYKKAFNFYWQAVKDKPGIISFSKYVFIVSKKIIRLAISK